MSTLITTIIIGISLSMDAFSLSLVYGTLNFSKKRMLLLSLIVGLYHFFMPLFGAFFGNLITKYLVIDLDFVVFLIFLVIGIEMIISSIKENKDVSYIGILGFFMFGFSVSIDSFTTGIGLNAINKLIDFCDGYMIKVNLELDKLINYKLNEKEILEKDIEEFVTKSEEYQI